MVERYQQPGLPSPVVGTPGVDPSAGKAAEKIAQASNAMVSESLQYSTQQFNNAAQQFAQAGNAASTFFARHNALKQAQKNHQNALLVTDAKLDQQRAVDKAVVETQAAHIDDPNSAADSFSDRMGDLKDQLLLQFKDPGAREMAMRQINPMLEAGRGYLQAWGPKAISAKIDGQLKTIPERLSTQVGNIDSTLAPEAQLTLYRQIMDSGTASYQELAKQSAAFPEKLGQIAEATAKLHQNTSKQLAENAIANIPDTEAGLKIHDQWESIVNHADKYGLDLPEKSSLVSALRTQKNQSVQTQVTGIRSDSAGAVMDIKIQQAHLAENFDNPAVRKFITKSLLDTSSNLEAQLAEERKKKPEPGSAEELVHKENMLALNQQIGQLVGAETAGMREKNSYEALQRQLINFSHGMTTFEQGQTRFQQGQLLFQQGQQRREESQAHKESLETYNSQMTPLFKQMDAVLAMPLGQAKLEAAQAHAAKMVAAADEGRQSGALDAGKYEAILKQAKELILHAEYKHTDGFFGLGAGDKAPTTVPDKLNAVIDAAKKMQSAAKAGQVNVGTVSTLLDMADIAITNQNDLAKVRSYLTAHGQAQLDQARKAGKTDAQIEQILPGYLQNVLKIVRQAPAMPTAKQQGDAGMPHTLPVKAAPTTKGFAAAPAASPYAKEGSYRTELNPTQEAQFKQWVKSNNVPFADSATADYDMRGYFRDVVLKGKSETAINPNDHQLHFPDTYKTPFHKSFSRESKYAKANAPYWKNDHQLVDEHGNVVFDEKSGG